MDTPAPREEIRKDILAALDTLDNALDNSASELRTLSEQLAPVLFPSEVFEDITCVDKFPPPVVLQAITHLTNRVVRQGEYMNYLRNNLALKNG